MTAVVGIIGPSYCGSTIFERILGQLEGVQPVGESHWLIDRGPPWRNRCATCGDDADCPVFTPEVLSEANNYKDKWFGWLQNVVKKPKVMLTADKNIKVYDRIGIPDKAIVLFRDPTSWVTSWVVRAGRATAQYGDNELPRLPDQKVLAACDQYVQQYMAIFDWLKAKQVPAITVWMESLINQPRTTLAMICQALRVPENPTAADLPSHEPVHTIAGNADVVFKRAPKVLRENTSWRKILTMHQFSTICDHEKLQSVYKQLRDRHTELEKGFIL